MKSQTSKAALKSLDLTEFLVMSARTQKPTVSSRLAAIFLPASPDGEGASVPDWDLVQESHAVLLETSAGKVRHTDQVHRHNKVKLSEARRSRRKLVWKLKIRHRDLRSSFTGTYGKDALPLVGLDAPPELRFVAIREQQLEVLERMRNPELAARLPEPRAGQKALDLTELADAIEAEIRELEAATEAIRRLRKQVDESLVVKEEVLAQHRRLYLNVARILAGYYRLAGLDELADRIRSPERPRRRQEASDEPSGDSAEASGDSEQAPADSEAEPGDSGEAPEAMPPVVFA